MPICLDPEQVPLTPGTTGRAVLDPIEDITRRRLVAALPAFALLLGGVSCGDDDDDAPSAETTAIDDAFGTVTVPANPERIVAVRHHHIGNMLALGVTPVGMVPAPEDFPIPGHAEALAKVANVRSSSDWELDIEKALALAPDLILEMSGQEGDPWNEEICQRAKTAVPTLCFPYGYTTEAEIKQNMLDVGVALGLRDRAEAAIAEYESRLAALKPAAARFAGRKVATIFWTSFDAPASISIAGDQAANLILRALGIEQPALQADPSVTVFEFSFENIEQLNEAWAIIVMPQGAATREGLESNPLWQFLEPAKAGRVVFVDGDIWGQDYMPALMHMLADVESLLLPLAD